MKKRRLLARAIIPARVLLISCVIAAIVLAGCGGNDSTKVGATQPLGTSDAVTEKSVTLSTEGQNKFPRPGLAPSASGDSAIAPAAPVKLVFIHHSVGEALLDDSQGGLGKGLMDDNFFVSDTNYGWGPLDEDAGEGTIGDHTDIGNWYNWFLGPHRDTYMEALIAESNQHASYSRLASDPGGENDIIMFKSCFPNSALGGSADDEPAGSQNLLRGQSSGEAVHNVQNAKGIYNDLLEYFATRQDKLFVVLTAPPLIESETDLQQAANARAFNVWLVEDWLRDYPHRNVAVFDLFNVLTSNGGSPEVNDFSGSSLNKENPGNQHRWWNGGLMYYTDNGSNFSAYAVNGDSHPTAAGLQKASGSLAGFLDAAYNSWKETG
jgi:hypothetical protein